MSIDFLPPPCINKYISSIVIAKSVRYSCAKGKNPLCINIVHFVVTKAVTIIISKGILANLVNSPISKSSPHIISKDAAKDAQNSGLAKPMPLNRSMPSVSGNINFCIPSDTKISPTVRRISNVGVWLVLISLWRVFISSKLFMNHNWHQTFQI